MNGTAGVSAQTLALILATILMLALGQVLFKFASGAIDFASPKSLVTWPLVVAILMYGVATLAWLAVLARVPLSTAFPFYGLGFVLVPLLSALLLGEKLRLSTIVGGIIIMVGIIVSTRRW